MTKLQFQPAVELDAIDLALQTVPKQCPHGQAAVGVIDAFDNVPGGFSGAGAHDHPLRCRFERVIQLSVVPVTLRDPRPLQRIRLQALQPVALRVTAQVHPELNDECVVVG